MKNVLIAVCGSSPQIVTETLWALSEATEPPVHVDSIHVVTTSDTEGSVSLLLDSEGPLAQFCRDYSISMPETKIHIFKDEDGNHLNDIRTSRDSKTFAAGITDLVRRLTMDPHTALFASIAGGRKTMGFQLGQAMTLYGREQDRLSHVLVSEELERRDDFYYPPRNEASAVSARDAPAAAVELTDISFVRVRNFLRSAEIRSVVTDASEISERAQARLQQMPKTYRCSMEVVAVRNPAPSAHRSGLFRLDSALTALESGTSLAVRIVTCPTERPGIRIFLDCVAHSIELEEAKRRVASVADSVQQTLNIESSGLRVNSVFDEPSISLRDHVWRVVPAGMRLYASSTQKIAVISEDSSSRSIEVSDEEKRSLFDELKFPIADLDAFGGELELTWSIERKWLADSEMSLIGCIRERLYAAETTTKGDTRFDADTTISGRRTHEIQAELERWTDWRTGFATQVTVRSDHTVPQSLLASVGKIAFGGRPTFIENSERSHDRDPTLLRLGNCFCADRAPPFGLPAAKTLIARGFPTAWPPAPRGLPQDGVKMGSSESRPIHMASADRARHMYAIGSTGTGKSTLLRNLILQDIEEGRGVFVLDPHGDLYDDVTSLIPASRAEDVVLLNAAASDRPFGVNILEIDEEDKDLSAGYVTNELLSIFLRLYGRIPEAMGPMFEQYFRMSMMLLLGNRLWPNPTLMDVGRVYSDAVFRDMLRNECSSTAVRIAIDIALKAKGEATLANIAPYIVSKLNRFILNPLIRNITCQKHSTVNFRQAMDDKCIVIANLPKGYMAQTDVAFLGMLLIGRLFSAALSRSSIKPDSRVPMYVYIDEFQSFATESSAQMMAEVRKFGLNLTLANQNLSQLDRSVQEIVLGNSANLLAFRTGPADASVLKPFFTPTIPESSLTSLPNFHCAARLLSDGSPVNPAFVLETDRPFSPSGELADSAELTARSFELYTQPRESVEKQIEEHAGYKYSSLSKDERDEASRQRMAKSIASTAKDGEFD